MRVAVIHDWLNGMRGGEKVLEALLELYPSATIHTLFHERGKASPFIESYPIVTSWLNGVPGIYRWYRNLLPLFPAAVESWDLRQFDLIISSSHAVAKGIRPANTPHVCYCHTPMRYVWDAADDYGMNPLRRAMFETVRGRLQQWDRETAGRVDHFIANSRFIRDRIRKYYGRDAEVIHPPIDTHFFTPPPSGTRDDFYLAAGALVPYKRFDIVVQAFNSLNRKLVVAGSGPDAMKLRRMAKGNIDFVGWVSNDELRRLYRTAKGLVFPAREDFGMVAVEARACGCPVIAFGAGGALETVQDGLNGILFAEQSADDLLRAVRQFETLPWPEERVRHQVEMFSREAFKSGIRKAIEEHTQSKKEYRSFALQTT